MIYFLTLLLSLSFTLIEDFSVTGDASNSDINSSDNRYEIYAGILDGSTGTAVDTICKDDPDGDGKIYPCNTCAASTITFATGNPPDDSNTPAAGVHVCNTAGLIASSIFNVRFKSTSTTGNDGGNGKHMISFDTDSSSQICESSSDVSANSLGDIDNCTWEKICNEFDNLNGTDDFVGCASPTPLSFRLRIGKDLEDSRTLDNSDDFIRVDIVITHEDFYNANNSTAADCSGGFGVCTYNLVRGDEKAYFLNTFTSTTSLPDINNDLKSESIRVYYMPLVDADTAASDCGATTAATFSFSSPSTILPTTSSENTFVISSEQTVTGLTNGTSYCFRTAIVDNTGFTTGITQSSNQSYLDSEVTPFEVNGLIQDGNCFIATAAYGSAIDDRLDILRNFRDQILLKSQIGKAFVDFYYEKSKPLAIWIYHNTWARYITQVALVPILAISYLLLNPLYLILLLPICLLWFRRRHA